MEAEGEDELVVAVLRERDPHRFAPVSHDLSFSQVIEAFTNRTNVIGRLFPRPQLKGCLKSVVFRRGLVSCEWGIEVCDGSAVGVGERDVHRIQSREAAGTRDIDGRRARNRS